MKKILIIILLKISLFSSDITLKDFVQIISSTQNINIIIDNDVDTQISLFLNDNVDNKLYFKMLIQVLNQNDLTIESFNDFFIISKVRKETKEEKQEINKLRYIKLNNVSFDVVKPLFSSIKDFTYSYISQSKVLIVLSNQDTFNQINTIISKVDKKPKQLKLKITILDTNINKLKEYGAELTQTFSLTNNAGFFFNLLAYPFSVNSTVDNYQKTNFNSYIKLLNQNSITKLSSSPTLTILDGKTVSFDVVKTIPFLDGSVTVDENTTKTTNSYSYKDVGLKIELNPTIYDDYVYFDISLINESILDNSSTPTISKSSLKQSFMMNKNKLFVLTGINQTQNYNSLDKTPFLSDLPFFGWFFKIDSNDYSNSNLTVVLELINDDDYTTDKFNVIIPNTQKQTKTFNYQLRSVAEQFS